MLFLYSGLSLIVASGWIFKRSSASLNTDAGNSSQKRKKTKLKGPGSFSLGGQPSLSGHWKNTRIYDHLKIKLDINKPMTC